MTLQLRKQLQIEGMERRPTILTHERNIRPLIPLFHHYLDQPSAPRFYTRIQPQTPFSVQLEISLLLPLSKRQINKGNASKITNRIGMSFEGLVTMWCKFVAPSFKPRYVQLSDFQSYYNTINNRMNDHFEPQHERFYKIEGVSTEAKRLLTRIPK